MQQDLRPAAAGTPIAFRRPQVNLYSRDLPRAIAFYERLGFAESFRYPATGPAEHVELSLDGFTLGIATVATSIEHHGLSPNPGGRSAELVLWTDDADRAFERLVSEGAPVISEPHDWLDSLRLAWVADPDGTPIQIVSTR